MFAILIVPDDPRGMTANPRAPLLINQAAGLGKQVILGDERYPLRHRVLAAAGGPRPAGV